MREKAASFRSILLVKRHRRPSDRVLAGAAEVADRCGARLTFADAQEAQEVSLLREERLRALEEMLAPHLDGKRASYRLISGNLETALPDLAEEFDMLFLAGSERESEASRRHFAGLLRTSPIPVWLANGPGRAPRRILAAVDVLTDDPIKRELNNSILQRALELAAACEAELDVLSVWRPATSSTKLLRRLSGTAQRLRPESDAVWARLRAAVEGALLTGSSEFRQPRLLVVGGDPDVAIAETAKTVSSQLVVAGSVGRRGLAGWIVGDTAERMSRRLGCSILAVTPRRDDGQDRRRKAA